MAYKGRFTPKNASKYSGNITNITYRSLWERQVMKWCDDNPNIVLWNSEEEVIPYLCDTDNRIHRYYIDFKIQFISGETFLVEVKPKKQTVPPSKKTSSSSSSSRTSPRFIKESLTYVKNMSKWKAAKEYAKKTGCKFFIWTEEDLKNLGIRIISPTKSTTYRAKKSKVKKN